MKKLHIFLILACMLIWLFLFYFMNKNSYFQNTFSIETDTQPCSWLTYKNTEYGFEFQYPSYVIIKENKDFSYNTVSKLRIESEVGTSVCDSSNNTEAFSIILDVVPIDRKFTYSQSETGQYNKESKQILIYDFQSNQINTTLVQAIKGDKWIGYSSPNYTNTRPYLGDIYIPIESKNILLQVSVRDENDLEDISLSQNFWSTFNVF